MFIGKTDNPSLLYLNIFNFPVLYYTVWQVRLGYFHEFLTKVAENLLLKY